MNRGTLRVLGIVAGVLGGTIAALLFRGALHPPSHPFESKQTSSAGQTIEGEEILSTATVPDPGRRNWLKQMVAGAKKEDAWLKDFELTERSGRTIKSEELRGEPYIACFFFSTCPGSCTRQSNQMQLLQSKFKGKPMKFVSISVDPDVDTPEVLAEYAERFQAIPNKWLFFTGPLDYIVRVGTEKFFLDGVEKRGHPDRFCLVNADGDIVGSYVWLEQSERDLLIDHANELLGLK